MKTMMKKLAPFAVAAAIAVGLAVPSTARAQVDPGLKVYLVYEGDKEVGQILRLDTNRDVYTEHWVLYPSYVYPSAKNGLSLDIRPGGPEYKSLDDFFQRAPFDEGSRYVRTECVESTERPRARR